MRAAKHDHERFARLYAIDVEGYAMSRADRPAFLARACEGDESLRADIESLLRHGGSAPMPRVLA
ncbi:MAG: hypothetical protein AAF628_28370, partial [Planctomycetota bacterium]